MSETLRNQFSQCTVEDHSEGGKVLVCLNQMGGRERHFVWNNKLAMCEYHMCSVLLDVNTGEHNTLSCSGAIMRLGDDLKYFNPLTPFGINFDKMLPLSRSAVDYFAIQYQYYFQDDVRSTFAKTIEDINCTNNMKTCITFNDTSLCYGNYEDVTIIHSTESLIHGVISAFALGALCYLFLRNKAEGYPMSFVLFFYIVPMIAAGMIYTGWFLSMSIPFLLGNTLVVFIFIILYYPLRDLNNYINNKTKERERQMKY